MKPLKAETKQKLKLISSLMGVLCAAVVLSIGIAYAWFAHNVDVNSGGMGVEVTDPYLAYFDSVDATKYELDGSTIVNHYIIENDKLKLSSSRAYDPQKVEDTTYSPSGTSFLFDEILPGEYVTLTVNYHLADEMDGKNYYFALADFSESGKFEINATQEGKEGTYEYYVVGVFKYKPVEAKFYTDDSLTDEITSQKVTYTDDFKYIDDYVAFKDEVLPESVSLPTLTWNSAYKSASFTFVLEEDISGFYRLVDESGDYYSNLLSEKSLMIRSLRIVIED